MKYRIFDTQAEAIAAEQTISEAMGLPEPGVNAKTGEVEQDKQHTTRWATPQQIQDGRWVFPSPDDEGVEAEDVWFSNSEYRP